LPYALDIIAALPKSKFVVMRMLARIVLQIRDTTAVPLHSYFSQLIIVKTAMVSFITLITLR